MTDRATDVAAEGSPDAGAPDGSGEAGGRRARGRLYRRLHANPVLAVTTKAVVTVVGGLVMLAGVVMLFTPGQGILAIILGLAILSTEYAWAARWLQKARDRAEQAKIRAQQMDPRVRRRRLLLIGVGFLLVTAAVVAYLVVYDWPALAVDGWDWVQSLAWWVPDLPGM